ncbi:MAG: cytochrome C oxidase subunit IV family protein [Candidatus Binatia bacterium]
MSDHAPHGPTLGIYFGVFATLVVLTGITVAVAFVNLGAMNNVVMIGVAVIKATLVVLYFMHVRYGPRLVWALAAGGIAWLAILVAFTLSDYLTRAIAG